MNMNSRRESSKNTKIYLKIQQLEDIKLDANNTVEDIFSWLMKFEKSAHLCTGNRTYQRLDQLLLLYTQ